MRNMTINTVYIVQELPAFVFKGIPFNGITFNGIKFNGIAYNEIAFKVLL